MSRIDFERILCFSCVKETQRHKVGPTWYVRCKCCGRRDNLEKAIDDCFIFVVASAMSRSALQSHSAHACRYMPLTGDDPLQFKRFMLETGRVKAFLAA